MQMMSYNKKEDVIVFDIGGTWFRSAIYTKEGELKDITKKAAINYKNTQYNSMRELQIRLVHYITTEIRRLSKQNRYKTQLNVAISFGAALNGHTGFIYNSGPLWGPECKEFDLKKALNEQLPEYNYTIINDVSAALLREVAREKQNKFSKIMLITISSGIACRIFDNEKKKIPVDNTYGLQGEIGHLSIQFMYNGKHLEKLCDCGGKNHINAFSSGRGITQVIKHYMNKSETNIKDEELFANFIKDIKRGDAFALGVLDAVIKPIADTLLFSFTIDPKIEKVVLTGGVIHSLKNYYMHSLFRQLKDQGLYQISTVDPNFFEKRIFVGSDDDNSGLIGAALSLN